MIHYSNNFNVKSHDGLCFISIRSTENRVDTFSFTRQEIAPFIENQNYDDWIGSERLSIKISSDRGNVKIQKGHSTVNYICSVHEAQKLMAKLEESFYCIENKNEESDIQKNSEPSISKEELYKMIDSLLAKHNQMLIHEIEMRFRRFEESWKNKTKQIESKIEQIESQKQTKQKSSFLIMPNTPTFIPSNMGASVTGKINTKESASNVNALDAANRLKQLKDKTNE